MNMKRILLLLILEMVSTLAKAGPIKDMATNHPDQWQAVVETGTYAVLLQFVKDAYAEHQADPNDATLQYVYLGTLDRIALEKQVLISLDFSLIQTDMTVRQIGARAVYQAVLKGAVLDQATRDRLLAKLKTDIAALSTPSREAFDFARYAVYALVLLGDDVGLDGFLTYTEQSQNLSAKDNWKSDTEATRFEQLANQYTQLANDPGNQNNEWEKTVAAMYQLAKSRRMQGREVKPLQPTVNIDHLLKQ